MTGVTLSKKQIQALDDFYADQKARYWATIAYPESMMDMDHLKGYATQAGLKLAISPLHDQDKKADHELTDGEGNVYEVEYKKPHYHIIIVFGNTTTWSTANKHAHAMGCVNCKAVSSILSYYKYLTHDGQDPSEKFIYNREQDIIQHVNGFDLADYAGEDKTFMMQSRVAVESLIDEWIAAITDLWTLKNFLKKNEMWYELKTVYQNEKSFENYIKDSKRHLKKKIVQDQVNQEVLSGLDADPGL